MTWQPQVYSREEAATPQHETNTAHDSVALKSFPVGSFVVRRDMSPTNYAWDTVSHTLTITLQLTLRGRLEVVRGGRQGYFEGRELQVWVGNRYYAEKNGDIEVRFLRDALILKISDVLLFEDLPEQLFNPNFDHTSPADKFRFCFLYWSGAFHFAQGIVLAREDCPSDPAEDENEDAPRVA